MIYLWLLKTNLFISSFTFGGGYVVVPMIRRYFVQGRQLFTEEELLNMSAISQSSPGAIAVNLSILAGWRTAGLLGALVSALGALLPPIAILSVISLSYEAFASNAAVSAVLKGMQAGMTAIMADLLIDMSLSVAQKKSWLLSAMIPVSFIACFFLNINVALILLAAALLGGGQVLLRAGAGRCGKGGFGR